MCCIMPWWLVLLTIGGAFIYNFVIHKDGLFHPTKRYKPKKEMKGAKNQSKAKNVNYNSGAVFGGGTTHRTNDANDDNYIAVRREEQAAYDDFIASLDMADDK